jgi:hypothetical protein
VAGQNGLAMESGSLGSCGGGRGGRLLGCVLSPVVCGVVVLVATVVDTSSASRLHG